MSARDALFNDIWDMRSATEKNALIDAHRDEVALEIGRDAMRDGLVPTLTRLVGEANAMRLLIESRSASADDEGNAETSARADLVNGLAEHACCFSEDDAKLMVAAFAHELAEKQRAEQARCEAEQRSRFGHLDHECEMQGEAVRHMADFIDPLKGATCSPG